MSANFELESIASTSRHCWTATIVELALDAIRLAVAFASLYVATAAAQVSGQPEQREEAPRLEEIEAGEAPGDFVAAPETPGEEGPPRGLTIALGAGIGYDDNVFRTESDTNSDFFWSVRPNVYLDGAFGKHGYRLGYEGDYRAYFDFTSEDFYDQRLLGRVNFDLTRKVDFNLAGHVRWGHDDRGGIGVRTVGSTDLDLWREELVRAELVVGREITRAQIIPWVEYSRLRYLNNDQSSRDYDRHTFWIRGRWRFTPRFWGIAETGISTIDYTDPNNDLDRTEPGLLAGFGWDATAKTSGEILVGVSAQDFDDSSLGSSSNFTYDGRVYWSPKPYSKFTAYARREYLDDASGQGDGTIIADTGGVRWRHAFSERLELDTGIEHTRADYDSGREDQYLSFDMALVRGLNRWLDVAAIWEHTRRDSNEAGFDFEDNTVLLELRAHFSRSL